MNLCISFCINSKNLLQLHSFRLIGTADFNCTIFGYINALKSYACAVYAKIIAIIFLFCFCTSLDYALYYNLKVGIVFRAAIVVMGKYWFCCIQIDFTKHAVRIGFGVFDRIDQSESLKIRYFRIIIFVFFFRRFCHINLYEPLSPFNEIIRRTCDLAIRLVRENWSFMFFFLCFRLSIK